MRKIQDIGYSSVSKQGKLALPKRKQRKPRAKSTVGILPKAEKTHQVLTWFNKSGEKTVFGRISKICGKNTTTNLSAVALRKVFDGQSVRSVAEELGVNESLIHKWKRAALTKGDGSRSGTELSEIEALKKRNRELEMEVEILKNVWLRRRSQPSK